MFVPVVDAHQTPLMPTTPARARRWINSGKATPFWKKGVFCVRLNRDPSARETQDIAVGIDPGSKQEGFTVKSAAHTYLNIQADAVTWVKDAVKTRRQMRRTRRYRKSSCRPPRFNRARGGGGLPPSTKARWQWKLRICHWLCKLYPITRFVVEDIRAVTKGKPQWDTSFSPLEVGKQWFYKQLEQLAPVTLYQGWETKQMRDQLGLKKIGKKTAAVWEAHCVDSYVLAWSQVGRKVKVKVEVEVDNRQLMYVSPLRFHRRQLHRLQPAKGHVRRRYGGTQSLGFKRGSLVKHPKYGVVYVGGTLKDRISLHAIETGERLCQNAKPEDCRFLTYNSWRWKQAFPPAP